MRVNEYYKKWCNEDYPIGKEKYMIKNAKYVFSRAWAKASLIHGIAILLPATLFATWVKDVPGIDDILLLGNIPLLRLIAIYADIPLLRVFAILGIFTFAFAVCAARSLNDNSPDSNVGFYIVFSILGLIAVPKLKVWEQITFAVLSEVVYIFLTFVLPIYHFKAWRGFSKVDIDMETEKERRQEEAYNNWKKQYNQTNAGIPDQNAQQENPIFAQIREWFEGFTSDPQTLKSRYRNLAKQYHPDQGGDEEMFVSIRYIYEELRDKMETT